MIPSTRLEMSVSKIFFVVVGWVVYQAKEQGIAQFIGFLLDPHHCA